MTYIKNLSFKGKVHVAHEAGDLGNCLALG